MKFGTNLLFEKKMGYDASVRLAAEAGFKYIDFDLTGNHVPPAGEEEKFFTRMKKTAFDCGMKIGQAHAPFFRRQTPDPNVLFEDSFVCACKDAVRRAAILESPYLVFHPFIPYRIDYETAPYDYSEFAEENFKRNVEFFKILQPDLKKYGVKAALENCITYDFTKRAHAAGPCSSSTECNAFIDALGDDDFCICLDVGHLNLVSVETHAQFIKGVGRRLKVLHMHDNFGIQNDWFGELDRHLPPLIGCLKWGDLAAALENNGFGGVYSLEMSDYGLPDLAADQYRYLRKVVSAIFEK